MGNVTNDLSKAASDAKAEVKAAGGKILTRATLIAFAIGVVVGEALPHLARHIAHLWVG